MGAYLSEPITNKDTSCEESEDLRVAHCSMQGWRVSQEDAHNVIINFDDKTSLFAVYDGHGGHEVAVYTAQKLPEFIRRRPDYAGGDFSKALVDSFVEFDRTIVGRDVVAELKKLSGNDSSKDDEEDQLPEEVDNLHQEATMSIEEVMAKYGGAAPVAADNDDEDEDEDDDAEVKPKKRGSVLDRLKDEEGAGSSSTKKLVSPFLRAKRESKVPEDIKAEDDDDDNGEVVTTSEGGSIGAVVEIAAPADPTGTEINGSGGDLPTTTTTTNGYHQEGDLVGAAANGAGRCADQEILRQEPTPKGKGKGKGKGKSGGSSDLPAIVSGGGESEAGDGATRSTRRKPAKTAEQLYRDILTRDGGDGGDDDEEDEEDSSDGEAFEHHDSSDDDDDEAGDEDDDEEEDNDDDDDESEEESEDEDMGGGNSEGTIGGDFNDEPGNDSGCTAVVALLRENELYVANAGDSRCVVCRDGKAVEMSFDHKPEDEPEMERIHKAGGKVTPDGRVNGGLNLSRAIGDHAYKTNKSLPLTQQMISPEPDIRRLTIDPATDSYIFLACDGIWNSMSSQEVVDFIDERLAASTVDPPAHLLKEICEDLFEHCLAPDTMGDGTGCDNMTAVLVKIRPAFERNKSAAAPSTSSSSSSSSGVAAAQGPTSSSTASAVPSAAPECSGSGSSAKKRPLADSEADPKKSDAENADSCHQITDPSIEGPSETPAAEAAAKKIKLDEAPSAAPEKNGGADESSSEPASSTPS